MDHRDASRIVTLKRYISLLKQEEKRLLWVISASTSTGQQPASANANLKELDQKLTKAEDELRDFESRR
jgi:hypothetical protein